MASRKASLADFQHRQAGNGKSGARRFDLARIDPQAKPFSSGSKARDKARAAELALEIDRLQDLFYADRRFKLLVVLQGTDTSGKDGAIRGVFGQTSALGVHAVPWKAPTADERAHDYLWRIHQRVPADGEMVIFNRSHYEDVLVPVVNAWISPEQTLQRYAQINAFEKLLVAPAGAARRPDQALEVRRRRPGRAQAVGCLPAGLPGRHRRHGHALGAMDGRAGRLEDAPQPDDRRCDRADAEGPEAALPPGQPGTRQHPRRMTDHGDNT